MIGVTTIMTSMRGMSVRPDCVAVNPSSSCMKSGKRNMFAMSSPYMTHRTSVPERNDLSRKSRKFTAGTSAVSSRQTNAASAARAIQKQAAMARSANQS
jgi:hypothetical protein